MREIFPPTIALLVQVALLAQAPQPRPPAEKPLDVYFLDTEGGQATLFVSPYGESMLVDTGFPGNQGMPAAPGGAAATNAPQITRDADRITSVLKLANIVVLDYVIITHYHGDHAGNAAELASRIPIRHFSTTAPTRWNYSRTGLLPLLPIRPCATRLMRSRRNPAIAFRLQAWTYGSSRQRAS